MGRFSNVARVVWLGCAFLQIALPGAVACADAREDETPAGPTAIHIEAHTTSSCPHAHDPDCLFCHLLAAPFSAASPLVFSPPLPTHPASPALALAADRSATRPALPNPRAPPLLS